MTLQEFNKKYSYKSDFDKYNTSIFDIWEIPKEINGKIESDCESYARFLKSKIYGFNDWNYYYCKLNGEGHCVLIKNTDVIDCNVRQIVSIEEYCRMFNITELRQYSVFQVTSKIIVTQIFLLWIKFFK